MKNTTTNAFKTKMKITSGRPDFSRAKFRPQPIIAPYTNPLGVLRSRRVMVLADVENLAYSARDLGYAISFPRLTALLGANSKALSLHAFFSRQSDADARLEHLRLCGWTTHTRPIQHVYTHRGRERQANCDNLLLFTAGLLASRSPADTILLASGDGDLVCSLVDGLKNLPKRREFVTLSLAGSTSWRLDASSNKDFRANIEIGLDCLRK